MARVTNEHTETHTVAIPVGVALRGDLSLTSGATGIVVFAHGSGSSRLSTRNQRVAGRLQAGGFATLLFDLLTSEEESLDAHTGHLRFDIPLLAERLARVTNWLDSQTATHGLRVGYFGASTGAAAALVAAAGLPTLVRAIVSRGGRPDLAGPYLGRVTAPTLLIVGGEDTPVIAMNRTALQQLTSVTKQLVIVPGATHLFEEPGTLDRVSDLALAWFEQHLATGHASSDMPESTRR
jgi:dienelactone hydrolase